MVRPLLAAALIVAIPAVAAAEPMAIIQKTNRRTGETTTTVVELGGGQGKDASRGPGPAAAPSPAIPAHNLRGLATSASSYSPEEVARYQEVFGHLPPGYGSASKAAPR